MNTKTFTMFDVADEEVVVSVNPENADYTNPRGERHGLVYFVRASNEYGDTMNHSHTFDCESDAERLCSRVRRHVVECCGTLNVRLWTPGRAVYGSDAYVAYGQEEDLACERRCDEDEAMGLR